MNATFLGALVLAWLLAAPQSDEGSAADRPRDDKPAAADTDAPQDKPAADTLDERLDSGLKEPDADPPSLLDEQLLDEVRRALDRTPGKADEQNPLLRAGRRMRDVEDRLSQVDIGEGTQDEQAKIVKDLEELIEHLKNCQSSSSCSKCQSVRRGLQPQQQAQPNNSGQQPQNQPSQDGARQASRSRPTREQPGDLGLEKATWGHLPVNMQQQLNQLFSGDFLEKYRELTVEYFQTLAKPDHHRAPAGP